MVTFTVPHRDRHVARIDPTMLGEAIARAGHLLSTGSGQAGTVLAAATNRRTRDISLKRGGQMGPRHRRRRARDGGAGARFGAVLAGLLLLLTGGSAALAQNHCIVLDDFSRSTPGQFPVGWQPREEEGRLVYIVREENGRRFLRAASKGLGIQAGRSVEWDIDAYPVLTWSWRPVQFPQGGDEREARKNDSALAVYFAVPYSQTRGPRAVKYIWSERVPVGTRLESNNGLTQVRVLRSGPPRPGAWAEERVNVLEDYRRAFGEDKTAKPGGIAVLTDADDTRSTAAGDYANFRGCRH
jgi:Protein of unknown function (DUF3047)